MNRPLPALCFLLFSAFGFTTISDQPPVRSDDPYGVTAMLNDSAWFGTARATQATSVAGQNCPADRFNLGILTDLPHRYSGTEPVGGINGCRRLCVPTQHLSLANLPLTPGRYDLTALEACATPTASGCSYQLLTGGDRIVDRYEWQPSDPGWVEITRYDAATNTVEGRFDVTVSSRMATVKTCRFQKGVFTTRLVAP